MKTVLKILKKVILSAFLLYIYNYFAVSFHLTIPINWITIGIVSFLDLFGLIGLVLFKVFIL